MSVSLKDLARLGGLARSAQYDGREVTANARRVFRDSFLVGHTCKVCKPTIIPAELAHSERERRAEALRRLHYARVALASAEARSKRSAGTGQRETEVRP